MVAWWWLAVALGTGFLLGITAVVANFWLLHLIDFGDEFREHERRIAERNAELGRRTASGCRRPPGDPARTMEPRKVYR